MLHAFIRSTSPRVHTFLHPANVSVSLPSITLCRHVLCVTCCMGLTGHYPVSQRTQGAIILGSLDTKCLISLESGCPVSLLTHYRCMLQPQEPTEKSVICTRSYTLVNCDCVVEAKNNVCMVQPVTDRGGFGSAKS